MPYNISQREINVHDKVQINQKQIVNKTGQEEHLTC